MNVPPDPSWHVYNSVFAPDTGQWKAQAWCGGETQPPQAGMDINLFAVAADPQKVKAELKGSEQVGAPAQLKPLAQSGWITTKVKRFVRRICG